MCVCVCVCVSTSLSPCWKFGSPNLGMGQQPQEQRYPFLSVCAVFSCVQTVVWLPVLGIFNVHTYIDACDCTRGPSAGHRWRVCTEKSLAAPGTRTCVGIAPGFSVGLTELSPPLHASTSRSFSFTTGLEYSV